jgi:phosphatidylserine/phosphatidylglycerophosphate/cardiolipin synthase-like enzyme
VKKFLSPVLLLCLYFALSPGGAPPAPVASSTSLALFSPQDKPTNTLISFIQSAKKSIHAAVYCLTDKKIAQALIDAHARGVDVKLVLDPMSADRFGKAEMLAVGGVTVFIMDHNGADKKAVGPDPVGPFSKIHEAERGFNFDPIMHNKYALFDEKTLWTGSFNWTNSANTKNWENALVIDTPSLVRSYQTNFLSLCSNPCCKPFVAASKISEAPSGRIREKVVLALEKTATDAELIAQLQAIIALNTDFVKK